MGTKTILIIVAIVYLVGYAVALVMSFMRHIRLFKPLPLTLGDFLFCNPAICSWIAVFVYAMEYLYDKCNDIVIWENKEDEK